MNNLFLLQKQISRRDPKTTVKSTIITKNLQYHRAHEAVINNRAAKDPVLLEYEIENLKQKVFRIIPGLKSEMKELREIWVTDRNIQLVL